MADATQTVVNQVGFAPEVAPYGQGVLGGAAAAVAQPYKSYADWAKERGLTGDQTAQFSALQKKAFTGAETLGQNKYSTDAAAGLAGLAQQAGNIAYTPGQFNYQQINSPNLGDYQMQAAGPISAERVNTQSFTQPGSADQYMNPYMQSVVDIQKREAGRQSAIQGTQQQAQAAQAGAFGGSRDAIMRAERERNLSQQMGDIQATGSQAGFQNAQQQFNEEQAARLQAQQGNQRGGLEAAQTNQSVQQQANLENLGAGLQTQGLRAQTGMQAQIANQQQGFAAQQAAEQSRQFGSNFGLQGRQIGLQGYSSLGSQGQNLYGQTTGNLSIQSQMGAQQQQGAQNLLDVGYQNYVNEMNDPYKRVGFASDIVRGAPMSGLGSTVYQPQPSTLGRVATAGALAKAAGAAKGGAIKSKKPAGLAALLVHGMA